MPPGYKKKPLVQKRLSDYFPEEHIVITSGLILVVVGLLTVAPALTPRGLSTGIARAAPSMTMLSFTLLDAFLIGAAALAFVFALVYVVQRYAKNI